ncbi:MAG TPA: aspartyl/asparaginyl beta-hydroxylase domain-containing protein [Steroidobacteraceae bacterium]|nr:aspartyl/asparaginyl beta-hydroxylase domain-containing protein [Steroidobacteraceae bacterium]
MRLPQRFYRLPVRFDVDRLRSEVASLPAQAWSPHPAGDAGNDAVRLISVEGGENEEVNGVMRMTPYLERSPYLRQVLASFGVVWSRSRLLRLAPGAKVHVHADVHHHWFYRVRMHIPVVTRPEVQFTCDGERVHMAAGEAWLFDNWRLHQVDNPTDSERIHLVGDTSGSASFWELAAQSDKTAVSYRPYDPSRAATPLTERALPRPVMPPAELDLLIVDLRSELALEHDAPKERPRLGRYHALLLGFGRDWRRLYSLHGEEPQGHAELARLRDAMREQSRLLGSGLVARSNKVAAHRVLEARILRMCLWSPAERYAAP